MLIIIVADKATFVTPGNTRDPAVLLTLASLLITVVMLCKRVRGGLLLTGMIITTVAAMIFGYTEGP